MPEYRPETNRALVMILGAAAIIWVLMMGMATVWPAALLLVAGAMLAVAPSALHSFNEQRKRRTDLRAMRENATEMNLLALSTLVESATVASRGGNESEARELSEKAARSIQASYEINARIEKRVSELSR